MVRDVLRSLWIWGVVAALNLFGLPLVALVRLFDHEPAKYHTGRLLRRLAALASHANPLWRIKTEGLEHAREPRRPYVVVANHQSHADVPIIARLPWEMKWMARRPLFRVPFLGWMMRLAGDIPVTRGDPAARAATAARVRFYLDHKCSVAFFPEGTRSRDGKVHEFADGAFRAAIEAQVPVLPVAVIGTGACLPRDSWIFRDVANITLRVLPPVETAGLTHDDVAALRDRVRAMIAREVEALPSGG
jgi:1-acyl-sn-glycerol-3-phosphate acyltransferase